MLARGVLITAVLCVLASAAGIASAQMWFPYHNCTGSGHCNNISQYDRDGVLCTGDLGQTWVICGSTANATECDNGLNNTQVCRGTREAGGGTCYILMPECIDRPMAP